MNQQQDLLEYVVPGFLLLLQKFSSVTGLVNCITEYFCMFEDFLVIFFHELNYYIGDEEERNKKERPYQKH